MTSMLITLLLAPIALGQAAVDKPQRMREIVDNFVDNKSFMGVVLVAEKDKILLNKGFGSSNLEWNIANDVFTKFRIGSITKQFTAAGILLLQEQGKLKIDQPVKTYLPDAPGTWEHITVYNLMTHTSGIPNFTSGKEFDAYKRKDHTPTETIKLFSDKPLDFQPGGKFNYSNSNYIVLGQIIEKVSGMPYGDFLRQNIFTPLQMSYTGVDSNREVLPQRAQGYEASPDGFIHADNISMTVPYAAGFLYSTSNDLLKWEHALFGGKILSPESLKIMTTPFKSEYATGLFIKDAAHYGVITHNGTIDGFDASLNYYPDKQFTIIVLGNVRTDAPDKIAALLGKVAYDEKVFVNSDRVIVPVAPSILADYAGHFSAPPFSITISVEGNQLIATNPAGRKYHLYSESPTKFFLKEIDVQIEFLRDSATNKVNEFLMTQEGTPKRVARG